MTQQDLVSK